jgi:hypothetical protein
MAPMICKVSNGTTFRCGMRNHTCPCSDRFIGKRPGANHVSKRRNLKRRERNQWKKEIRSFI